MYFTDYLWLGNGKQIIIAAQIVRMVFETLSPKILFAQLMALYHGTHGAIKHQDALLQ